MVGGIQGPSDAWATRCDVYIVLGQEASDPEQSGQPAGRTGPQAYVESCQWQGSKQGIARLEMQQDSPVGDEGAELVPMSIRPVVDGMVRLFADRAPEWGAEIQDVHVAPPGEMLEQLMRPRLSSRQSHRPGEK